MIKLHSVSGVDNPAVGKAAIHLTTAGYLATRSAAGVTTGSEAGSVGLSGLTDVTGTFASGQAPSYDGSVFRPFTPVGGAGSTPTLTIYASGEVEVMDLLFSGVVPDGGTPAKFTWSGIDQTYTDLEIRGVARAQAVGTVFYISIYFNNDTTAANYASRSANYGGTLTHTTNADSTPCLCQGLTQLDSNIGSQSPVHLLIPDYAASNFRKHIYTYGVNVFNQVASSPTGAMDIRPVAVQWLATAGNPINMMEVRINNATQTFCSGTALYMFGKRKQWVITSGVFGGVPIINGSFTP